MKDLNLPLDAALQRLKGHRVSSVDFVEDYVQVHFDNACLTAYTLPRITLGDVQMEDRSSAYREALYRFEGSELLHANVEVGKEIIMNFSEGCLNISLRDEDYQGPEALQLKDADGRLWVT
jgi:hypothetical protein